MSVIFATSKEIIEMIDNDLGLQEDPKWKECFGFIANCASVRCCLIAAYVGSIFRTLTVLYIGANLLFLQDDVQTQLTRAVHMFRQSPTLQDTFAVLLCSCSYIKTENFAFATQKTPGFIDLVFSMIHEKWRQDQTERAHRTPAINITRKKFTEVRDAGWRVVGGLLRTAISEICDPKKSRSMGSQIQNHKEMAGFLTANLLRKVPHTDKPVFIQNVEVIPDAMYYPTELFLDFYLGVEDAILNVKKNTPIFEFKALPQTLECELKKAVHISTWMKIFPGSFSDHRREELLKTYCVITRKLCGTWMKTWTSQLNTQHKFEKDRSGGQVRVDVCVSKIG
jgi:hypothetical protein